MLICIGEILVDIFDNNGKKTILPGGAVFNVACNATLYTKNIGFIGKIGNDENGKMLMKLVNEKKFTYSNVEIINNCFTTRAIVTLKDGERTFKFERDNGADYMFDLRDFEFDFINDKDIIHIGSLMLSKSIGRKFFFDFVKKIKDTTNALISFDINYRDDIFSSPEDAKNIFNKALSCCDIIKFSLEEILLLSGEKDLFTALNKIITKNQIAVVTLGHNGSVYYHNGDFIKVPTKSVKPVDTTGAGDAYYSYFLSSLINNPKLIYSKDLIYYSLRRANACGALTTLKIGAINSAPTEEEITSFLNAE